MYIKVETESHKDTDSTEVDNERATGNTYGNEGETSQRNRDIVRENTLNNTILTFLS